MEEYIHIRRQEPPWSEVSGLLRVFSTKSGGLIERGTYSVSVEVLSAAQAFPDLRLAIERDENDNDEVVLSGMPKPFGHYNGLLSDDQLKNLCFFFHQDKAQSKRVA